MVTCDVRGDSGPEREKHRAYFKWGGGEHLSEEAVCFGLSLAGKGGHPGKELEVEHPCRKESRGRPRAGRTGPTRTERMGHLRGRVLSGRRAVEGRARQVGPSCVSSPELWGALERSGNMRRSGGHCFKLPWLLHGEGIGERQERILGFWLSPAPLGKTGEGAGVGGGGKGPSSILNLFNLTGL